MKIALEKFEYGQLFWIPCDGIWRRGVTDENGMVTCHRTLNGCGGYCYHITSSETRQLPLDTLVEPLMHR